MKTRSPFIYNIVLLGICLKVLAKDYGEAAASDDILPDKSSEILLARDRGYKNWEERCLSVGGDAVLADFLSEQEHLIYCMMEQFNTEIIQHEIETKKHTGDLDEVFKRYCSENVPVARNCLKKFLSVSSHCLLEEDRPGLNITLAMLDQAINFTCHSDGDRIALFMSEEGVECVSQNKNQLISCVKKAVPEFFAPKYHRRKNINELHFYVFQQENCRKGDAIIDCVEKSLLTCDDPTPSNLLHGLLTSMRSVTPCSTSAAVPAVIVLSTMTNICFSLFAVILLMGNQYPLLFL